MEPSRARRLLACLGDPSRFRVIEKLMASRLCVTELAREIGLSQSCTTRHLQALQKEGLVVGLRSGKRVVFRLRTEEPMIAGLVTWALSHAVPAGARETDLDDASTGSDSPLAVAGSVPVVKRNQASGAFEAGMPPASPHEVPPVEIGRSSTRSSTSIARTDDIDDFLL